MNIPRIIVRVEHYWYSSSSWRRHGTKSSDCLFLLLLLLLLLLLSMAEGATSSSFSSLHILQILHMALWVIHYFQPYKTLSSRWNVDSLFLFHRKCRSRSKFLIFTSRIFATMTRHAKKEKVLFEQILYQNYSFLTILQR